MGFEHEEYRESYMNDQGVEQIYIVHCITHPEVPGLFLSGSTIEKAVKNLVTCVRILTLCNEAKLSHEQLKNRGILFDGEEKDSKKDETVKED